MPRCRDAAEVDNFLYCRLTGIEALLAGRESDRTGDRGDERAIALDVSALDAGEYALRIGIETRRGHSVASTRAFRVAERRSEGS